MQPSRDDNSKYVGIEIECFGPLNRREIEEKLSEVEGLRGKFRVGTDRTIRPTPQPIGPKVGQLDIAKVDHARRKLDCMQYVYNGNEWVEDKRFTHRSRKKMEERLTDTKYWCNMDNQDPVTLHPYEIRLLCKQNEIEEVIPLMYKTLLKYDITTNESCGLHVHLDMRNRNVLHCYHNFFRAQGLLIGLCPRYRIENNYSRPNTRADMLQHLTGGFDKYHVINPHPYVRQRTLEIRVAEGTMDIDAVVSWTTLLCNIADIEGETTEVFNDMDQYIECNEISTRHYDKLIEMEQAA